MSSDNTRDRTKSGNQTLNRRHMLLGGTTLAAASAIVANNPIEVAQAQPAAPAGRKPNILFIMGDDIGWYNISAYNMGVMGYRTPNIDRIGKEGAVFTDWYGQQSCTAGRRGLHHRPVADPHRPHQSRSARRGAWPRPARPVGRGCHEIARLCYRPIRRRTTWEIATSICRPCTASTNSSAISIT